MNYMEIRICACCGKQEVKFFDICEICGWENDPLQNDDPNYFVGANVLSLNEYKKQYFKDKATDIVPMKNK